MRRAAWIALMVLSSAGGWIFGRMELAGTKPSNGETSTDLRERAKPRNTTPPFAVGSPRGLWMEKVRNAKPGDFPGLNSEWETVFEYDERYDEGYPPNALNALRWMMGVWLTKDPEGFLKAVSDDAIDNAHWAAQAMVELMPEKAAELIFGPGRETYGRYFIGSIASALAEQQPVLYLKMNPEGTIDPTPAYSSNNDWLTAITSLAKTDAPAAGNASLRWKVENAPRTLCDALFSVAKAWKAGDPPISDWLNAIPDPKLRNFATHAWLSALAEKDPEAALKELNAAKIEDDNDLRHDASREILMQLAKAKPAEALKLLNELERDFSKYKYSNPTDPFREKAAEEEAELPITPFSHLSPGRYSSGGAVEENGVRFSVLNEMAKSLPNDPAGLVAELRKLTGEAAVGDASWRRGVEGYLIRQKCARWSVDECLAAAEMWSSGAALEQDDDTLQKLPSRAAAADPERALAEMQRFPESARTFMMAEIVKQLRSSDTEIRIALLEQLPAARWDSALGETLGRDGGEYAAIIASPPVPLPHAVKKAFAREWGKQDPEATAKWIQLLPDDEDARSAAGGLASAWIRYDGDAATAWAAALPSGPVRDAAADHICYWLSMKDSTDAWRWAASISDPLMRAGAYDQVAIYWKPGSPWEFRAAHDKARADVGQAPYQYPSGNEDDPFR